MSSYTHPSPDSSHPCQVTPPKVGDELTINACMVGHAVGSDQTDALSMVMKKINEAEVRFWS